MPKDKIKREVLPIPDKPYMGLTTYTAKDPDTKFPKFEPLRPPEGAPNVLVILLDDVGFGASSAFGGPVNTPTAERLAGEGLKYTRFHSTALCAPTRQALLTGRNHHSVGMGMITEAATPAPGYNAIRPNNKAPLPEILKRSTVTPPLNLASVTKCRPGRPARWGLSIAGRPVAVSSTSMALWLGRHPSTIRPSTKAPPRLNKTSCRRKATTLPRI